METTQKLTPLMQQYWEIKNQHLDKILLYRMGDFYEMFYNDAVKAAPILNIALTARNKNQGNDTPMCGVPYHSIGPQINKLLQAGLKVAICDQMETPAQAEGKIVRRAVTRIVTPGLVYDPDQLEALNNNYVAALIPKQKSMFDFSLVDATTGELKVLKNISAALVILQIQKAFPKEIVIPENFELFFDPQCLITKKSWLHNQSVENFLTDYVKDTQGEEILYTLLPTQIIEVASLELSPTTLKHLEIFKTYDHQNEGTLFKAINLTQTAMGARLLRARLTSPLRKKEELEREYDHVSSLFENHDLHRLIKSKLGEVGDMERKIVKLSNPLCNARDLSALGKVLGVTSDLVKEIPWFFNDTMTSECLYELSQSILSTFREELPHSTKEGGLIKVGVNSQLDEYVDLSQHAQTKLSELEIKERNASGIQSLKIKYNGVFGYSFEITKANLTKVPTHFVRRQTLAQAERFVTTELSELEQKILSSQTKRNDLEFEIYNELRKKILRQALSLLRVSQKLAHIDLVQCFATLARERNYVRPQITNEKKIVIKNSRHPVIEMNEKFIPNDIILNQGECVLLTGPNMAGKSTLMRQVALTSILAQAGCFVPAESAELPLIDKIFTRIGASDNLSQGLSTFMVEMTETAQIIEQATESSLIILDEIGRGTSTYDGLSLAQAVLEHFVENVHGYTFFATHYHELTELSEVRPRILNFHMSIQEHKEGLVFLRKLVAGPANRSYGIEVAKLAGLPHTITARAAKILKTITDRSQNLHSRQLDFTEISLEEGKERFLDLAEDLRDLNLNQTTPLEALNKLSEFKTKAEKEFLQ